MLTGAAPRAQWFIPAGAGNAPESVRSPIWEPVHPRGSGERDARLASGCSPCGSSPRERGTRLPGLRIRWNHRFIPAGAGNAPVTTATPGRRAVHPRGSGERDLQKGAVASSVGSSPRERGTLAGPHVPKASGRFIPAGAGNASSSASMTTAQCGSSPRERGTLATEQHKTIRVRFIPAGAGNASSISTAYKLLHGSSPRERGTLVAARRSARCSPVHPRGSGERYGGERLPRGDVGSSPRERGTRRIPQPMGHTRRFIPAGAGNAWSRARTARRGAVHPRGSGERGNFPDLDTPVIGSSPRERGTHRRRPRSGRRLRFIPAGAGNAQIGRS